MRTSTGLAIAAGVVGAGLAPVVMRTPRPQPRSPHGVRTVRDAIAVAETSGLEGWELVSYVQHLVHEKFAVHCTTNFWETPQAAFRTSRGWSAQYNSALWEILLGLGFSADRVFATRVRQGPNPWWRMGHIWVRVTHQGRTLDVCAAAADNRPGHNAFVPVTEVLGFNGFTHWNMVNGMLPFTSWAVWRSVVEGSDLPPWLSRPFGTSVSGEVLSARTAPPSQQ